jgi:hypothetical protein
MARWPCPGRVLGELQVEDLHRDALIELLVVSQQDGPHPAAPDHSRDAVLPTKDLTRCEPEQSRPRWYSVQASGESRRAGAS